MKRKARAKTLFKDHNIFMGLFLLITPFIYTGLVPDPVLLPRTVCLTFLNFIFAGFLVLQLRKNRIDPRVINSPLTWVFLGYVLLSGVSVVLSVNPGEGLWKFMTSVLFFMIFLGFALAFSKAENYHHAVMVVFVLFSVIALSRGVLQLVDVAATDSLSHQSSYRISSWFAHRNLYAQVLLFALPFLGLAAFKLNKMMKAVAMALIVFSIVMITILLVRSVWLALVVSVVFCLLLMVTYRKPFGISRQAFRKISFYLFGCLMVIMISIAVYARFGNVETFEKQTYVLQNYRFGSAIERVHLWEKSVEMFKDSPVIGIGTANWQIDLPHYGTGGMRSAEGEIIYQRPHNDFLWVLAENGIITCLFYVMIFLITLWYQIAVIRKSNSMDSRFFMLALFFFMISYVIVAFLSFPSERPVASLLLVMVFAFTLVEYQKLNASKRDLSKRGMLGVLVLIMVVSGAIGYVGVKKFRSGLHVQNALQYRLNNQWQKVIDEVEKADDFFTRLDPTATPLRWYSGLAWFNLGQKDKALADFRAAYQVNPYHMHVLNNLGTILGEKGEYDSAIGFFREAVRISPMFSEAVINLSSSLYNIGKTDSAYRVIRNAAGIQHQPNYEKVVKALVYKKVEDLKTHVDDRDLEVSLTRIRNSGEWMIKVHEQSVFDDVALEDHLILESIYLLEYVDKCIDSARADYLRKKYVITK